MLKHDAGHKSLPISMDGTLNCKAMWPMLSRTVAAEGIATEKSQAAMSPLKIPVKRTERLYDPTDTAQ